MLFHPHARTYQAGGRLDLVEIRRVLSIVDAIESSLAAVSEFNRLFEPWTDTTPEALDIIQGAACSARAKEKLAAPKG